METTDEKIPVWLWMEDIDQDQAKDTVYKNTGLKETDLSVVSENISQELMANLTAYNHLNNHEQQTVKGEMQSYLERTKIAREIESQRVDTYLQELRSVQDDMLKEKNQSTYTQLGFSQKDIMIEQTGAPMYVAQLTKDEIIKAAKNPKVTAIHYYDIYATCEDEEDNDNLGDNSLEASLNSTTLPSVYEELGLYGNGVKVGFIESGRTKSTSSTILSNEVTPTILPSRITNLTYIENEEDGYFESIHATQVAEIAVGENGVAREASVYSFALSLYASNKVERFITAIDLMCANGVSVINMSMYLGDVDRNNEPYTELEIYLDYLIKTKNFTFVKSAGNIPPNGDQNENVITSPGLAYNVITVGGYFNKGNSSVNDDVMFSKSRFGHLTGCIKPDIVSNQISFNANNTVTGTSFAAPVVTGVIALLYELRPTLKIQPEAVKAILTASCHRKVSPFGEDPNESIYDGLTNHQGAGAVDPYTAIAITGSGHYGIRNMPGSASQETIQFYQPKYNATGLNVSVAWSVTNPTSTSQGDPLNLNLSVYNNSVLMGSSANGNSSSEMVYVTPSATNKNYAIQIINRSNTSNPIRYAYAYSINNEKYQHTDISEGIFYLKNKASGKYLTFNSSKIATQASFAGGASQQWLLSNNGVNAVSSQNNRLAVGELIDNGYRKAVTNTSSGVSVMFQQNTENYQRDGSITIYRGSNDTALGIYNNSTANGATAAWSTYDSNNEYQKWYLEPVAYQRGDINRDGSFSTTDYNLVYQYVYGSATLTDIQLFLADVNGDYEVDATDISKISELVS